MVREQPTGNPASVAQVVERESTDPRVIIAHGYGIKVTVFNGHLEIVDGIGAYRRARKIPKVDRTVRRIIITGSTGFVSLAALRWCKQHQIAVITADPFGELVAASPHADAPDAPTIRAQACCGTGGPCETTGLAIARMLTERKLHRQAETCWNVLGRDREAREIRRVAQHLESVSAMSAMNLIEAEAARHYWSAWSEVQIAWKPADLAKIPAHWLAYCGRISQVGDGNRAASHPVNALLNYAYAMLATEARLACLAAGLDPSLGFLHSDRPNRESLVYDLIECARPVADEYVLSMLAYPGSDMPRRFGASQFTEVNPRGSDLPAGTVRLVAPLTHEIAEQSVTWAASLYPVAEQIARMVAAAVPGRMIPRAPTADKTMMARSGKVTRAQEFTAADVIPDNVWSLIESLADQLPWPSSRATVSKRDMLAALIYSRAHRVSRTTTGAMIGASANTMVRRYADWRDLDAFGKIEDVIREHARRSPNDTLTVAPERLAS